MKEINWLQVIIGFLSGGAFGAFIKQYFDNRKNRIQPIGYRLEMKQFYDSYSDNMISSKIVIQEGGKDYKFETLYTGSISIFNTGNTDYPEFVFGLTYEDESKFIQIRQNDSDRHHVSGFNQSPSLENQVTHFDITLKPFNRKDRYDFDFIVSTTDQLFSEDSLKVSTAHSVKLKTIKTEKELLNVFSKSLINSISLGIPLKFR